MKTPDLDRARSEKTRSLAQFLAAYNEQLPASFPQATSELLEEFRNTHRALFKSSRVWSLDIHRKKVMDWLRARPIL